MTVHSQGHPAFSAFRQRRITASKFTTSNSRNLKFLSILYLAISIIATILLSSELGLGGLIFIVLQGMIICSVGIVLAEMAENLLAVRKALENISKRDQL